MITCPECKEEHREEQIRIVDEGFSYAYGSLVGNTSDLRAMCPDCGEYLDDLIDVDDVIELWEDAMF